MTIETKYSLNEKVFFMPGQLKKVVSAEVMRIDVTIERTALDGSTTNQEEMYIMQGKYGPIKKSEIFSSREELLKSL